MNRRGTVSTLWLRISGRASMTIFSASSAALEIGDEHFDRAAGVNLADALDDHGEDRRAAILAVVAVDAGDDGVLEVHGLDGLGDALRLEPIQRRMGGRA